MKHHTHLSETPFAERAKSAKRIRTVSVSFLLFFAILLSSLVRLEIFGMSDYQKKVWEEVTATSPLRAERGKIYDRNLNVLASEQTVWRVFLSPKVIAKRARKDRKDYQTLIAENLSLLLDTDRESIEKKLKKTSLLDVTVKAEIDEETHEKVLAFIRENALYSMIFTEAQTTRTYPEGTLAAHVIGFVGSDLQGLYGLEYRYDDILKGKDGSYLYAKDAGGNSLPSGYAAYTDAVDGNSIITTIDTYLQAEMEATVENVSLLHGVQNRVTGILMDVSSGAILAMATSAPFDPNDPYTLSSFYREKLNASGLSPESDEYRALRREYLETMWSNKAVSELYEPGSTFKIVTVSSALDLGVATMNDRFSCPGFLMVGGWRIRCHKTTGHGSGFTLAYGLQMSCNPTMMKLAERIGSEAFYSYVKKFGYLEKTGIDLPSEAVGIFHSPDAFGTVELATASFGQRFKVSIIGQLCAVAAVANGGRKVTPYLVEKIIDKDGNTVSEHEHTQGEQIISESVAKEVARVLEEGVSGDGGAKNAAVEGYKVAAKTGTSQKFDTLDANGNSYLRIGSTVAFAPSDEAGVAMILVVDEPTSQVKYGSTVAAPYVGAYLAKALPYLGYAKSNAS